MSEGARRWSTARASLQDRVVTLQSERTELQATVASLQAEKAELLRQLEAERTAVVNYLMDVAQVPFAALAISEGRHVQGRS